MFTWRPNMAYRLLLQINYYGMQLHLFIYILSSATFELQEQSGIVATMTLWPAKLKIFAVWPFIKKVC